MGMVKNTYRTGKIIVDIEFLRSSSYNNWEYCEHQYFINYVLGIPRKTGKKAQKGTIVHKVMECLANIKKQIDKYDIIDFEDKEIGKIGTVNAEDLYYQVKLSNEKIDEINNTRINKDTYLDNCKLSYGHVRQGVKLVEKLIDICYNHYAEPNWYPVDYKDCTNFVWMVLDYKDGLFDPRNKVIIDTEKRFDIEIDRDWARLKNDKKLKIKGTIDLITEAGDGIIEICDYKSGRRLNWVSKQDDQIKTYEDFCKDFQLMLYYYAAHYLYPKAKQILVTIFYIRDGGPFTVCFDDETLLQTEEKIFYRLKEIQKCQIPTLHDYTQQHFKCKYLCDYCKIKGPDNKTNMCLFIHEQLKEIGMEEVVKLYTHEGFKINEYDAPGEK